MSPRLTCGGPGGNRGLGSACDVGCTMVAGEGGGGPLGASAEAPMISCSNLNVRTSQDRISLIHWWKLDQSLLPNRGHACNIIGRQFLHTSVYVPASWEAMNRKLVRWGVLYELASRYWACIYKIFNFVLCRELLMRVNIPVQKWNATCRIVASAESSMLVRKSH